MSEEITLAPCGNCPFTKKTRQQSTACVHLLDIIDGLLNEYDPNARHTCHKTDPRADGFDRSYSGPTKLCSGFIASAQKSRYRLNKIKIPIDLQKNVFSFNELKETYRTAIRRYRRWEKKRIEF